MVSRPCLGGRCAKFRARFVRACAGVLFAGCSGQHAEHEYVSKPACSSKPQFFDLLNDGGGEPVQYQCSGRREQYSCLMVGERRNQRFNLDQLLDQAAEFHPIELTHYGLSGFYGAGVNSKDASMTGTEPLWAGGGYG